MTTRRWPVVLLLTLTAVVALAAGPRPAAAQDAGVGEPRAPTTVAGGHVPTNDIVVKPNSGASPQDSGDRGGAAQLVLLGAIIAGLAVMGALASREVRKAKPPAGSLR